MNKEAVLNIRITPKLKAILIKSAQKEGLSLSGYITRVLTLKVASVKSRG